MQLLFATGNRGKLREAREILDGLVDIVSQADLGITAEAPETGSTLLENSIQKAELIHSLSGLPCFADDTGLEVDALGGAPGVHAARFAQDIARRDGLPSPPDHDFSANIDALLSELAKHPGEPRTARFRSVITLIINGEEHFFEGVLEGSIAAQRSGAGGFGYDPVFVADEYPGRSVAELPEEVKNAISHRGKSLRAMAQWLKENITV
ncbi:MAG: RdgB/HAM1 family non-canonical purine NTP pyrophosphatase [Bacteroidales bacterium]|nr:RdgB/HAM1 family non-canonical purine NTP pyrophosphatase [Bacteroidales bacterium]